MENFITNCSVVGYRKLGIILYESSVITFNTLVLVVVGSVIDIVSGNQMRDLIDSITFICGDQVQVVLDFLAECLATRERFD